MESDQCSVWKCVFSLFDFKKDGVAFFDEMSIQWNVCQTFFWHSLLCVSSRAASPLEFGHSEFLGFSAIFIVFFFQEYLCKVFFVFLWSYYPAELRVGLLSWAQFRLRTKNARLFNASANMAPCCLARLEARRRVREGREGGRGERVRGWEALTYQASWGRENLAKRTLEIEKV